MADSKRYNGSTWEHSLRKLTTATDTLTTLPIDLYADGNNATVGLKGDMEQSGTPTPTAPIFPSECGKMVNSQWALPIFSAGQTNNIYLSEVPTTRYIKKLVLNGTENWTVGKAGTESEYYVLPGTAAIQGNGYSSHYIYRNITTSNTVEGMYVVSTGGVRCRDKSYSSVDDFKSFLAQQYANGTPVTVWYVLATPETGVLDEPLRKIGYYADTVSGITIPTITGADSFDVLTTLKPSEVSLTYTGWHDAQCKEFNETTWE